MSLTFKLSSPTVETMASEESDLATMMAEHLVHALCARISRSRLQSIFSNDEILKLYLDMPLMRILVSTASSALLSHPHLQNPTVNESDDLQAAIATAVAGIVDFVCPSSIDTHGQDTNRKVRFAVMKRKGWRRRAEQVLETVQEEDDETLGS